MFAPLTSSQNLSVISDRTARAESRKLYPYIAASTNAYLFSHFSRSIPTFSRQHMIAAPMLSIWYKTQMMVSTIATMRLPAQIVPNDDVIARLRALSVGWSMLASSHQLTTVPAVVTCEMLRTTCDVQYSEKMRKTMANWSVEPNHPFMK